MIAIIIHVAYHQPTNANGNLHGSTYEAEMMLQYSRAFSHNLMSNVRACSGAGGACNVFPA